MVCTSATAAITDVAAILTIFLLGTHTDNMRDMWVKGRARRPNTEGIRGEANAMARLTEPDVIDIRTRYRRGLGSQMAAEYGVSSATISMIVTGKTWAHAPGVRRMACTSKQQSTRLQTSKHQPRPDSVAA